MSIFGSPHFPGLIPLADISPAGWIAIALSIGVALFFVHRTRQRAAVTRRLAEFRANWGRAQARDRDLETFDEFHQVCPPLWSGATGSIDDHTWNDLNMNSIYAQVERTWTTAGDCLLYRILRHPLESAAELEKRNGLIHVFDEDARTRESLQLGLLKVGRLNARGLISLIWTDTAAPRKSVWLYYVLTALAVTCLAGALMVRGPFVVLMLVCFVVNMSIHYRARTSLMGRLGALRQLGALIRAAPTIAELDRPELMEYSQLLRERSAATQRIANKVALLLPEGSATGDFFSMILEYVSIYFLHEVRTFHSVILDIIARKDDLKALFRGIGELDAWQSIASFRAGLKQYALPQFTGDGAGLEVRDAVHPLVDNPVPNSIDIRGMGIAITGSNMSGKTTFLRTVGVNVLLAQTIYTVLATFYRGSIRQIITSMNESDSLLEGKSYYLAEAQRLLAMVRQSEGRALVLCLIDEPLAGTNSPERLAASREILRYLVEHNGTVMVSTHDVELVSRLQTDAGFEAYHFADQADDQGIRFDYLLRSGLDYHGNAIKVLKYLGFPTAIIDSALRDLR